MLLAPTGSGKTLAAFLTAIDRLCFEPPPEKKSRLRVLYVSPLKALAVDVERNLRAPIAGISAVAAQMDVAIETPNVEVRTGDTPASARARMARTPPDILITTPESLYLLLTSQSREMLASVDAVIVDEIHSLVASKRGAHLFLSLERLEDLRKNRGNSPPLQRIGLSATQRPLDEIARLLGGRVGEAWRPVEVIDASEKKKFDLRVEVPIEDMSRLGDFEDLESGPAAGAPSRKSFWPSIHPRLLELIHAHRSTIVFVNSRRLAERLAGSLNELDVEQRGEAHVGDVALAHHGSVAREKRLDIEDRLKRGELPAIVATSSLELGIDMGAVDLVIQIEAPPSVASAMQRIGRAGHQVGAVSQGVVFPKHRGDLLPCAAAITQMEVGAVEATFYPRNPLDVLAQQVVAHVASMERTSVDAVFDLVRQSACFSELSRGSFEGVLDMLSGRYPSDEFAELRPRLTWDRVGGMLKAREGAQRLAVLNGGTIADRGLYGVFLLAEGKKDRTSRRVGELDEEMVFESRVGETFVLGASSWRIEDITHDRVLVSPAPGVPGKMPFWHGDRPGRPIEFGRAIGALARTLADAGKKGAHKTLKSTHAFDEKAAKNLVDYLFEQKDATGVVPSDRTIVVERFVDEVGDWRVCMLSPFGARVHAPWATAIVARLQESLGEIGVMWSDDGMVFRVPQSDAPPAIEAFLPSAEEIEDVVVRSVGGTSLFAARFREAATRSLLLPRHRPGKRMPLWAQRKRASDLLAVASRHGSFPIVLETYREVLRDVFDLPALVDLLRRIERREVRVVTVDARQPSPFAASLMFAYVANFIYEGDAPLAERRAQVLALDTAQLRELLGEAELRELLDPDAIEEHERTLQHLTHEGAGWAAKSADGLHDLLLSIGDLSLEEIAARVEPPSATKSLVGALEKEHRALGVKIAGKKRWIASEDVGRYRDALGVVPPLGVPRAFLQPVADPLGDLVARFARTHGPFLVDAVAHRFGIAPAVARNALEKLAREGRVVEGEFLRGGTTREFVDAEVLRSLRRKSLARLRKEAEPVEPVAYARFLPEWQGVVDPSRDDEPNVSRRASLELLLAAIERLQGAPIPASVLETEVLPARVPGYHPTDLDALCAAGEVVWGGVEPIGPSDGRVSLFLAEHEPLLARIAAPTTPAAAGDARKSENDDDDDALVSKVRALLNRRGAVFFGEIARELGGYPNDLVEALWTLVWRGEATNDTLAPLRSRVAQTSGTTRRGRDRRVALPRLVGPPGSEGRWSLRASRWPRVPTDTERRTALAHTLLDRYGVLMREAVHAEGVENGFAAVYDVLKAMEESGRTRRGYFVAGRGASQFALPGAIDRLRSFSTTKADERPRTLVLAATDPANPYGAALAWPERGRDGARPMRAAGASVILRDGALVGFLGRSEQSLLTFVPDDEPARSQALRALGAALGALVDDGKRRAVLIATIDGVAASESPIAAALADAGFTAGLSGLLRRRTSGDARG